MLELLELSPLEVREEEWDSEPELALLPALATPAILLPWPPEKH